MTYYAEVASIEPYGDGSKYKLVFAGKAKPLSKPIPLADAPGGSMQGPRYTTYAKLMSATKVVELF